MKLATIFCCLTFNFSFAQVGINTENPDPSSILDISAPDKGILLPRVDIADVSTEAPVNDPATGLVVWNTGASNNSSAKGIYFWNGNEWERLIATNEFQNNNGVSGSAGWSKNGDNVQSGEFIGSTNYQSFVIKTNSQEVAKFDPQAGAVSLGYGAQANRNRSVAIGSGANAARNDGIAIGTGTHTDFKSTAIGHDADASGNTSLAIGRQAEATFFESNAIGRNARSLAQGATALGNHAKATQAESIILGDHSDSRAKVGIGTLEPTEKLQINGHLRMVDGNEGEGKVLTSDQNGKAFWSDLNSIKTFGQINKDATTILNSNTYIEFGDNSLSQNVTQNSNSFRTMNFNGIYKVSYTITMSKWRGGPVGVKFFLAKNNSNSNYVTGSETFIEVDNNDKVTVHGSSLVRLDAFESIGLFSDISNSNVKVHAEGTSMIIELVKKVN